MPRDSILDDAAQSGQDETDTESDVEDADHTDDADQTNNGDRTQFTQRTPPEILEDVERVKKEYGLPSRNATIISC